MTGPIEIVLPQEAAGEPDVDAGGPAVPVGAFAATGAADALSELFEPVAVTAEQPQLHAAAADRSVDRAEGQPGMQRSAWMTAPPTAPLMTPAADPTVGSTAGSSGNSAADDPGLNGRAAVDGRPERTMESSEGSSGNSSAGVVSESSGNADAVEPDASDAFDTSAPSTLLTALAVPTTAVAIPVIATVAMMGTARMTGPLVSSPVRRRLTTAAATGTWPTS